MTELLRRCRTCGLLRPAYWLPDSDGPPASRDTCMPCWRERWVRDRFLLAQFGEVTPEEPVRLGALGYTRKLRSYWVCTTCGELYQRGVGDASAQLCSCRRTLDQERWPGFDFNERVTLCYCCLAAVLPSGSKFSVWFCDRCRAEVDRLNQWFGRTVIPIGRHSFMTSGGLAAGRPREAEELDAFADRLYDLMTVMSDGIDRVYEYRAEQFRELAGRIRATHDLRIREWLERVGGDTDAGFGLSYAFVELSERFVEFVVPED